MLIRSMMTGHHLGCRNKRVPMNATRKPAPLPPPNSEETPLGGLHEQLHSKKSSSLPLGQPLSHLQQCASRPLERHRESCSLFIEWPSKRADSCHSRSSHLPSLPQAHMTSTALPFPHPLPNFLLSMQECNHLPTHGSGKI